MPTQSEIDSQLHDGAAVFDGRPEPSSRFSPVAAQGPVEQCEHRLPATPSTKRAGSASLLLGLGHGEQLRYAGRVGTGFTRERAADIAARLAHLETKAPPASNIPPHIAGSARWVRPPLVAEVTFTEFTRGGLARRPSFVGLRDDKPAELKAEHAQLVNRMSKKASIAGGTITSHGIQISSPDREQYPAAHITKRDLVAYYEHVGELMLPHIRSRPLMLIRCPRGQGQRCFVQQHAAANFPEAIKRVAITEASGATEEHVFVEDLAGILACVQMGVLEFHGWGSRAAALEAPDRLVFDLDPDPSVSFRSVADAALLIRDRLQEDGLVSWPMLSGGKGIHVIVPLAPANWLSLSAYARHFAEALERDAPRQFTSDMAKVGRKERIFVDYLRNERGATAVMPYSTRAKPSASVATPVAWGDLGSITSAQEFTVRRFLNCEAPGLAKWSEEPQRLPQRATAKSV